ncbi:MAG: hypothetical protein M1825_001045 [Sarcosagium campestre]|nr:MAG: hypothetical protein M1825_001045 [Sarcosagium campestre]
MVLAKSKNAVGLGNSLMNDRFGRGKGSDRKKANEGIRRTGLSGESYVVDAPREASWVKMRSVTEQGPLEEFLTTADLADTDFTAQKMNSVKVIHPDQRNPYLLSADEERTTARKHTANRDRLTVPRRPQWDTTTTPAELDKREKESLLEWRRGLAQLQEVADILMTPFERNLEVWRQLWRVIERSDLIVQIVDARNPLLFRSEDLEKYVREVDSKKRNLLLVNKADMMTLDQRKAWADYFEKRGISYKFFSAALAKALNDVQDLDDASGSSSGSAEDADELAAAASNTGEQDADGDSEQSASEEDVDLGVPSNHDTMEDPRTRILTVDELEELFLDHTPSAQDSDSEHTLKTTIGLVGYPNVGKSSTINALIGAKKVSVSATPGKTKHFQTIHLSPSVILCDCPGLVFPNFATTKAELVCNGILPIDQLREFTGPSALVAQRIPQSFLEALYGLKIHTRPAEEGGTGQPTAEEVLRAYAIARGFATTGKGQPDESRAARHILKDYINGKLLFCHPPPEDPPINPHEYNRELYNEERLPQKRRHGLIVGTDDSAAERQRSLSLDPINAAESQPSPRPQTGPKSRRLDRQFFGPGGNAGHLKAPYRLKYGEQGTGSGKQLSGRKQRLMLALDKDVDPKDVRSPNDKKHFKTRRGKHRSGDE